MGRHRTMGPVVQKAGSLGETFGYTKSYYPPYPWNLTNTYQVPSIDKTLSYAAVGDDTHPGPPYRSGGPFQLMRYSVENFSTSVSIESYRYRLEGNVVDGLATRGDPSGWVKDSDGLPDLDNSSYGDVSSYGATGWSKFKPGKPAADLGVFLAEMKDIPRMMQQAARFFKGLSPKALKGAKYKGQRYSAARKAGEASLSVQFGWMPFLSDMCKFYNAYKTFDDRIKRIIKYNGRWERRGGTVLASEDNEGGNEYTYATYFSPAYSSMLYSLSSCRCTRERSTSRNIWFEAAFRYYIPEYKFRDSKWRANAVRQMFGGTISPSVLYEATPWSWLVDYFSNMGDVVSNLSDGILEDLVAKYAYIMGTTETQEKHSHFARGATSGVVSLDTTYRWTCKTRMGANPFGFGLTMGDLSLRQSAILASLGLSRSS